MHILSILHKPDNTQTYVLFHFPSFPCRDGHSCPTLAFKLSQSSFTFLLPHSFPVISALSTKILALKSLSEDLFLRKFIQSYMGLLGFKCQSVSGKYTAMSKIKTNKMLHKNLSMYWQLKGIYCRNSFYILNITVYIKRRWVLDPEDVSM